MLFRYSVSDGLLHIGIERARNLAALFIPDNTRVWVEFNIEAISKDYMLGYLRGHLRVKKKTQRTGEWGPYSSCSKRTSFFTAFPALVKRARSKIASTSWPSERVKETLHHGHCWPFFLIRRFFGFLRDFRSGISIRSDALHNSF